MERIVCIAIGYLLGCLLTADVLVRRRLGKSAFDVGSGNPGMANVGRLLGVRGAAVVLAGDIAKTILAVVLAALACRALAPDSVLLAPALPSPPFLGFPDSGTLATLYAGLGATLGHNFPFWHRFRGGKGVTTTCAATILFHPLIGVVSCLIGFGVVAVSRQLCFGAVCIPVAFIAALAIFGAPPEALAIAAVLLVLMLVAHGGPCLRALRGEEPETKLFKKH